MPHPQRILPILAATLGLTACSLNGTHGEAKPGPELEYRASCPAPGESGHQINAWTCESAVVFEGKRGRKYVDRAASGQHEKRLYTVEGSPYQMGVLMGLFAGEGLKNGREAIKELIRDDISRLRHCPVCVDLIFEYIKDLSVAAWNDQQAKGHIPSWLVDENQGLYDGAHFAARPGHSKVRKSDLIVVNYAAEVIMAKTLHGKVAHALRERAESAGLLEHFEDIGDEDLGKLWHLLTPGCDGYAVKNEALARGEGVLLARSLQAGGTLWAEGVSYVIRKPICDGGPCEKTYQEKTFELRPTLSVASLGQVGALTVMNADGFATGTQTLRTSAVCEEEIGIGSALLARYSADVAATTKAAVAAVRAAVRGVPYVHIMGDPSGDIAAVEIIRSNPADQGRCSSPHKSYHCPSGPTGDQIRPYDFLRCPYNTPEQEELLTSLLPPERFQSSFPPDGVFPRRPEFENPSWTRETNLQLFARQYNPVDADEVAGPTGMIWEHYYDEWPMGQKRMGSFYFPPARVWSDPEKNKNKVLSGNYSLQPEITLSGMTHAVWLSGINSEAGQWRFDHLNKDLQEHYGEITVESWKGDAKKGTGMQYISPWARPGYPLNVDQVQRLSPDEYSKVHISGSLAIMDLAPPYTMHAKFGYWGDPWTEVKLADWLALD